MADMMFDMNYLLIDFLFHLSLYFLDSRFQFGMSDWGFQRKTKRQ